MKKYFNTFKDKYRLTAMVLLIIYFSFIGILTFHSIWKGLLCGFNIIFIMDIIIGIGRKSPLFKINMEHKITISPNETKTLLPVDYLANEIESNAIAYEDGQQLIIKNYNKKIIKIKSALESLLIQRKDLLEEKQIFINIDTHNGWLKWEKQYRATYNSISGQITAFEYALTILEN